MTYYETRYCYLKITNKIYSFRITYRTCRPCSVSIQAVLQGVVDFVLDYGCCYSLVVKPRFFKICDRVIYSKCAAKRISTEKVRILPGLESGERGHG